LSSKIHLLADSGCRPPTWLTSAGQRHDSLAFVPLDGPVDDRAALPGAAPDPARAGAGR
jgi:hypothetical protein